MMAEPTVALDGAVHANAFQELNEGQSERTLEECRPRTNFRGDRAKYPEMSPCGT